MKIISEVAKAEEAVKYATRYLKPVLLMTGAWPLPATSSFSLKLIQKVEQIFTYSMLFLMLAPSLLYVFQKEKNGKVRMRLLGPIANSSLQACKYTVILWRTKEIQIGFDMIKQHWIDATEESRLIMRSKADIARRLTLIVIVTMFSSGLCYRCILPLMRETIVTPDNITVRPLPCPANFIILDSQRSPYYEIIFAIQVLAGFVSYAGLTGACGVCALLVLHTCSMLKILGNKIKDLGDKTSTSEAVVQQKIMDIVEYHTQLKVFLKNAKNITEYICLFDLMGGTTLICMSGYYLLVEWDRDNITGVVIMFTLQISLSFCVFILCYIGQLLVNENDDVGQTSCTVNWYRLSNKHARCLVLIIAVSNYPIELTAGKTLAMSLATFTDVMKVALGYMRMLRDVA